MHFTLNDAEKVAAKFDSPETYGHFIDGAFEAGVRGKTIALRNPATGVVCGHIQEGDAADVRRAIDAAARAFPGWARMYPGERQALLVEIIRRFKARMFEYAVMESVNNGKTVSEAYFADMFAALGHLETYTGAAFQVKGETFELPDASVVTFREPVGVVAQIIPWNVPMIMFTAKIGPALAAGCTIVIKPSEIVCLSIMEFVKDIQDILPPGVLNVVTGFGADVGEPLVTDPRVRKVAFTGSKPTAQKIIQMAAVNIIPQTMELGGKSAHIICSDADLDAAAESAVLGNIYSKGEMCVAGSRLFVHCKVEDKFLALLTGKLEQVRQGNPLDPATNMGAQASQVQYDKILNYIELGRSEGATVAAGGGRANVPGLEQGLFIQPTILTNARNDMRFMQEEIFGAVTGVVTWDDEEDLLRQVNDTSFGLAGGVWSNDLAQTHRLVRGMETGIIWVNRYLNFKPNMWMGGYKQSGFGREGVVATMDHYTVMKSVVYNHG
jgi:acyl-CoA reductase-like NAD-dependent aldehyde dehydrogenase